MKINNNRILNISFITLVTIILIFIINASAKSPPHQIRVLVKQKSIGSKITYSYQILNKSRKDIVSLIIGFDNIKDGPELFVRPIGWDFYKGLSVNSATSPINWDCHLVTQEESPNHWIQWDLKDRYRREGVQRKSLKGFSIKVPIKDEYYQIGHFKVIYSDSTEFYGKIEAL